MRGPLPGLEAQITMSPRPRSFSPPPGVEPRRAGGLLLLYPVHGVLHLFLDTETRREEDCTWRGEPLHVPFYVVREHKVWGATAIILAEFMVLLTQKSSVKTSEEDQ